MPISESDLETALDGMHYPSTTAELLMHVERNGAPAELVEAVRRLPEYTFDSPEEARGALPDAG
jgi:hypothetical protein